jgi:hypothetical protein
MGTIYGEIQGGRRHAILVDDMDPAAILMQAEDGEDDEQITLTRIEGIPRDCLTTILRFVIPASTGVRKWRVAQLRLICLAHLVGIDGVADLSITQIADELGITKAALSHWNVRIADELLQAQSRAGKSKHARAEYSRAATLYHARAGHRLSDSSAS